MSMSIPSPLEQSQLENDSGTESRSADKTQSDEGSSSSSTVPPTPLLEWKFIDFHKTEQSPIFVVDPLVLKKFIGHYVVVVSQTGGQFTGCCLAIDPVSLSVILANRIAEGKIRIVTLPGYHLERIFIKDPSESEHDIENDLMVSVNDADVAELFHAPNLYSESKSGRQEGKDNTEKTTAELEDSSSGPGSVKNTDKAQLVSDCPNITISTSEDIAKKREALEALLKKHHMPFKVNGEVLEMIGGVKISPPYTIEACDTKGNQIIKKRLGEMMKALDSKTPAATGS
ncbi:Gem-associated protein 6 [Orchesella cincta]|uniref:Gem-associated protein 6 n=1 Tax=Orchesella cincta TaxID=48709 RepID=A0A1D2NG83_ORCCI|nr:Gem-associated protein 6 [Orchesella cincta]